MISMQLDLPNSLICLDLSLNFIPYFPNFNILRSYAPGPGIEPGS